MDNPHRNWLQLPDSFAEELVAGVPLGLWLQSDGCYNKSSWVVAEFTPSGYMYLTRGWKSFARAHGLKEGHTLHFKFDGAVTLFVKIFGEAGGCLECCTESDSNGDGHSSNGNSSDGGDASSGRSGSERDGGDASTGRSGSDDDTDEPPRRRIKKEEDSD
ncbi:hypothetical protein ACQJBY_064101 [Aegilops geniculata]